jgi:hypothetical protein
MDRVTGDVGMVATTPGETKDGEAHDYVLKCTPAQRMF